MTNRTRKNWTNATLLAVALWGAVCAPALAADKETTFQSPLAFDVTAVIDGKFKLVGSTPAEQPLAIPPCEGWYVEPLAPVDLKKVFQQVQVEKLPGLKLAEATDASLEDVAGLKALEWLDLSHTQITDAGLKRLAGLTGLRRLNLAYTQVTDAGLEGLKGLTALQHLDLKHTRITSAGLAHLKGMTALQTLYVQSTQVGDAGLEHLKGLAALRNLDLGHTQITDAGLAHLKGLTGLQGLWLWQTQVTDAGIAHLTGLKALRTLDLSYTQIVTTKCMEHLKCLTGLQYLIAPTLDLDQGEQHLYDLQVKTMPNQLAVRRPGRSYWGPRALPAGK